MYYCKLVKDGFVVKSLYREGDSEQAVLDGLNMWEWPEGQWKVEKSEGEQNAD